MALMCRGVSVSFNANGDEAGFVLATPRLVFLEGTITYLVGENGAGKTVLMNAMNPLIEFVSDDRAGHSVTRTPRVGQLRQRAEENLALSLDVVDNLAATLPGQPAGRFISRASLPAASLSVLREIGPDFADRLGQSVSSLSGGQRQLLALACLLQAEYDFLLLDEFTAAADRRVSSRLRAALREYCTRRRCAAVVVSHTLNEVIESGDRAFLLREGSLVADIRSDSPQWNVEYMARFVARLE